MRRGAILRGAAVGAFGAATLVASAARADTVVLKSGQRLRGTVVEEVPGKWVVIHTTASKAKILWFNVASVERDASGATTAAAAPVAQATPPVPPPLTAASTPGASPSRGRGGPAKTAPIDLPAEGVVLADGQALAGWVQSIDADDGVVLRRADGRSETLAWSTVKRVLLAPGHDVAIGESAAPESAPSAAAGRRASASANGPVATVGRGGVGVSMGGTLADAQARRERWMRRGGVLLGYDAGFSLLYLHWNVQGTSVDGEGGGGVLHGTYYKLNAPDPTTGGSTWSGWRVGTGIESAVAHVSAGSTSITAYTMNVPISLGGQVGLGKYEGEGEWRGIMLGADYRPSYQYTVVDGNGSGAWNWYGFQVTLDFTTLRAALERQTRDANWRLSAFVLPPVDSGPLIVVAGAAIAWY